MRKTAKQITREAEHFLKDYEFRSFINATVASVSTAAYMVYNFILGLLYGSAWNSSISVYYLVLFVLRGTILLCERRWKLLPANQLQEKRVPLFRRVTHILLGLDCSLVIPISLMVLSQRTVTMTMIPAIATAAYTTYKVTLSVMNYKKTRTHENLSLFALRIINLKDAIVSVLTLQNTMVMVFGTGKSMQTLTAYTSAGMLVGMLVLTVLLIRRGKRMALQS